MTDVGLDWSWGRPNLDEVRAAGYRFVLRYISYDDTGKNITPAELHALLGKGFEVGLNWEQQATDALGGAATGTKHATSAVHMAQALGYPTGCTIPFSVDFDATPDQLAGPVDAWARAAGPIARGAGYRFGAYGGRRTIAYLFDHGLIDDGWQSRAWSVVNGVVQWDPRAALRQDRNGITVGGSSDCDHNTRVGQTYFMQPTGQPVPSTVEDDMRLVHVKSTGSIYAIDGHDPNGLPFLWAPHNDQVEEWKASGVPIGERQDEPNMAFYHRLPDGAVPPGPKPPSGLTDADVAAIAKAVNDDAAHRLAE